MFEYFPENYVWNLATVSAVGLGGAISEIDEACRPLKQAAQRNDIVAQQAWLEAWKKVAERVESLAIAHEEAGHHLSAARKYRRAGIYYLMAERMLRRTDARKVQTYRMGLNAFKKGVQLQKDPIEWVEIPFQGKFLPALFSKAPGRDRIPCMVHFDGFDWLKEFSYLLSAEEFRRRGISLLVVDHPGVGEALRLRNMPTAPDTEVPAAACVDYLETRTDVDPDRIGIVALSLGGYYAPRAAAFEKRFKCCVAWGAIWDYDEICKPRLIGKGTELSVADWADQFMWVFGKDTTEEAAEIAAQFTLKDVADKIECPLLVMHGENDRQVPLSHAERTISAAVNSPDRKLKVFRLAEGGAEHCQVDDMAMAVDCMTDWVAEILGGDPKGV
jgi:dienelactone hydrolase